MGVLQSVQSAYNKQKRAMKVRAKKRLAKAKTKTEQETIKAQQRREALTLERRMYEAKAAALREKEAVARARRSAGILTFREQLKRARTDFQRGFASPSPRRRSTGKRKR